MSKGQISYAKMGKKKPLQDKDIQGLKTEKEDTDIYDEVLQDIGDDFLKYIKELVKPATTATVKTPNKIKQQEPQIATEIKEVKVERPESVDSQRERHKMKETLESSKTLDLFEKISTHKNEKASFFKEQTKVDKVNFHRPIKSQDLDELLHKSRHKAQKPCSNLQEPENRSFLEGMDEYLLNLQKQRSQDYKPKSIEFEELREENRFLRSKIRHYEDRNLKIQDAVSQMLSFSKQREKDLKKQTHQLNKALIAAVDKINAQKDEIEYLKDFVAGFANQLQMYREGRDVKHRLDKLLRREYSEKKTDKEIWKTLRTDGFLEETPEVSEEQNSDYLMERGCLSKEMTPLYMPSRSKTSSNILRKFSITKSNSRDSKQLESRNKYFLKTRFKEHTDTE